MYKVNKSLDYLRIYIYINFLSNFPNTDSLINTPRNQFVIVNSETTHYSETTHTISMPSQSRYFFVSFCVPNADYCLIVTPRIQFVLVKSETTHSSMPFQSRYCLVRIGVPNADSLIPNSQNTICSREE